ncbi:uncharacterized protein L201_003787 [Kwoniella dendrophila CBS 6074]|uniref:Uncharacterized protein n=1 Tax=Kwoniella dendrophila CBS 6074 TaxID=1295534 RepID=A0AAX4JW94_9TREE
MTQPDISEESQHEPNEDNTSLINRSSHGENIFGDRSRDILISNGQYMKVRRRKRYSSTNYTSGNSRNSRRSTDLEHDHADDNGWKVTTRDGRWTVQECPSMRNGYIIKSNRSKHRNKDNTTKCALDQGDNHNSIIDTTSTNSASIGTGSRHRSTRRRWKQSSTCTLL